MFISDRVYGEREIEDDVLLALIASAPVQRLKRINQAGASQYIIHGKDVSRYEHSIGVLLLLRGLHASIEEQIAGLLHDVAHTAFSHVADFVFPNRSHDYHDQHRRKIVMASDIPHILTAYGFDVERILDDRNFGLLERSLPDLCADRLDYTLRDGTMSFGRLAIVEKTLRHLTVRDKEIFFDDDVTAEQFARFYLKVDEAAWSHPREVAAFQILADAIKIALSAGIIAEQDLFADDAYVYEKLRGSGDEEVKAKLELLNPRLKIVDDARDYTFFAKTKLRAIDPVVVAGPRMARVSQLFPAFRRRLAEHKALIERGVHAKVVEW